MQVYNYLSNVSNAVLGRPHLNTMIQGFKSYVSDVTNAVQGKEPFADQSGQPDSSGFAIIGILFYVLIMIVFGVAYSYGAARISYCYNIYLGESSGTATMWSILAFLFAGYYYPMYGLFLAPCGITKGGQLGGRRYK
jgi:hypothetical protein